MIQQYMAEGLDFDCDLASGSLCGDGYKWCGSGAGNGRLYWTCFGDLHVCGAAFTAETDDKRRWSDIIHESTHNALHTTDRAYCNTTELARAHAVRHRGPVGPRRDPGDRQDLQPRRRWRRHAEQPGLVLALRPGALTAQTCRRRARVALRERTPGAAPPRVVRAPSKTLDYQDFELRDPGRTRWDMPHRVLSSLAVTPEVLWTSRSMSSGGGDVSGFGPGPPPRALRAGGARGPEALRSAAPSLRWGDRYSRVAADRSQVGQTVMGGQLAQPATSRTVRPCVATSPCWPLVTGWRTEGAIRN